MLVLLGVYVSIIQHRVIIPFTFFWALYADCKACRRWLTLCFGTWVLFSHMCSYSVILWQAVTERHTFSDKPPLYFSPRQGGTLVWMRVVLQRPAAPQSLSLAKVVQAADPLSALPPPGLWLEPAGLRLDRPAALVCRLIEWCKDHCDAGSGVEYQHTSFVGLESARLSDVCTIGIVGRSSGLCSVALRQGYCTNSVSVVLLTSVICERLQSSREYNLA